MKEAVLLILANVASLGEAVKLGHREITKQDGGAFGRLPTDCIFDVF